MIILPDFKISGKTESIFLPYSPVGNQGRFNSAIEFIYFNFSKFKNSDVCSKIKSLANILVSLKEKVS